MQHKGKNDRSNFNDKKSFSLSIKMQSFSPYLLDENQINSKREFLHLELNHPLSSKCLVIHVILSFIHATTFLNKL